MSNEALGFEAFKLNRQLLDAVTAAGYTQPTPIQEKAMMFWGLLRQEQEKLLLMCCRY
jgi:superfamily II DNA/RNA helicase